MTKIFVANFPFSVDDEQFKEFFSKVGNVVSAKVMTEGVGGRSRGFGFVEMSSEEEARKAIEELNGTLWDGRQIKVVEDRGHKKHSFGGGTRSGGEGDEQTRSSLPTGYFRAQPFVLDPRRRKKVDPFLEDFGLAIDYKDAKLLRRFLSERGRVLPRRMTGLSAAHQRQVTKAIYRAQHLALLSATEA